MSTTAKRVKDAKTPKVRSRQHNPTKPAQDGAAHVVEAPPAQPLPAVRPSARVPAQVRCLPSLLPFARAEGRDSGRRQVELVSRPRFDPALVACSSAGLVSKLV